MRSSLRNTKAQRKIVGDDQMFLSKGLVFLSSHAALSIETLEPPDEEYLLANARLRHTRAANLPLPTTKGRPQEIPVLESRPALRPHAWCGQVTYLGAVLDELEHRLTSEDLQRLYSM